MTYEQAFKELQDIVRQIENGAIDIDLLSEKVKRAGELIDLCKKKLKKAEDEVNTILKTIQPEGEGQ